jgi:hypothetical protein
MWTKELQIDGVAGRAEDREEGLLLPCESESATSVLWAAISLIAPFTGS